MLGLVLCRFFDQIDEWCAQDVLPKLEAEARERHALLAGRPPQNGGNNSTISNDQGKARDQAAAHVVEIIPQDEKGKARDQAA